MSTTEKIDSSECSLATRHPTPPPPCKINENNSTSTRPGTSTLKNGCSTSHVSNSLQVKQQMKAVSIDVDPSQVKQQNKAEKIDVDPSAEYVLHIACKMSPSCSLIISHLVMENPNALRLKVKKEHNYMFRSDMTNILKPTSEKKDQQGKVFIPFKGEVIGGSYPLHIALTYGASLEVVRILVEKCPEILSKRNGLGYTPLSVAIVNNAQIPIIQYLLSMQKNAVTFADRRMNLPLHLACIYYTKRMSSSTISSPLDVVKMLLKIYPEGVHKKNFDGRTPLDILVRLSDYRAGNERRTVQQNDAIVNLLQEIEFGWCDDESES